MSIISITLTRYITKYLLERNIKYTKEKGDLIHYDVDILLKIIKLEDSNVYYYQLLNNNDIIIYTLNKDLRRKLHYISNKKENDIIYIKGVSKHYWDELNGGVYYYIDMEYIRNNKNDFNINDYYNDKIKRLDDFNNNIYNKYICSLLSVDILDIGFIQEVYTILKNNYNYNIILVNNETIKILFKLLIEDNNKYYKIYKENQKYRKLVYNKMRNITEIFKYIIGLLFRYNYILNNMFIFDYKELYKLSNYDIDDIDEN